MHSGDQLGAGGDQLGAIGLPKNIKVICILESIIRGCYIEYNFRYLDKRGLGDKYGH